MASVVIQTRTAGAHGNSATHCCYRADVDIALRSLVGIFSRLDVLNVQIMRHSEH